MNKDFFIIEKPNGKNIFVGCGFNDKNNEKTDFKLMSYCDICGYKTFNQKVIVKLMKKGFFCPNCKQNGLESILYMGSLRR